MLNPANDPYSGAPNTAPFVRIFIGSQNLGGGTLAQPYPGQTILLGNVGFAAVLAHKTALDLSGYAGYNNTV